MSSLKDFINHDMAHKPNEVRGRTQVKTKRERNTSAYGAPHSTFNGREDRKSVV